MTDKLKYLPRVQDITKPQIWEKSLNLMYSPKFSFGSYCTPTDADGEC